MSQKVDLQAWGEETDEEEEAEEAEEAKEAEEAEEAKEAEEAEEALPEPLPTGDVSHSLPSRLGVALPAISSGSIVTHCSKKRRQVIPSRGPDADETDHLGMLKLYLSARGNQDDLAGWSTQTTMRTTGHAFQFRTSKTCTPTTALPSERHPRTWQQKRWGVRYLLLQPRRQALSF